MSSFTPRESNLQSWALSFICPWSPPAKHTITPKANTFQRGYQQMKKQTLLAWMRLLLEKRLQDWTPKEWKLSRRQGWQDILCNSSVSTTCWMSCLLLTSHSCFFMKWSVCFQHQNRFILNGNSSCAIVEIDVLEAPKQEALGMAPAHM